MKIKGIFTKNSRLSICFCLFVVIVSAYAAKQECGNITTPRIVCFEQSMYCPEPACVPGSVRCRKLDSTARITCWDNAGARCTTDSIKKKCESY